MGRDRHHSWKGSTEKVKLSRFAKVHGVQRGLLGGRGGVGPHYRTQELEFSSFKGEATEGVTR